MYSTMLLVGLTALPLPGQTEGPSWQVISDRQGENMAFYHEGNLAVRDRNRYLSPGAAQIYPGYVPGYFPAVGGCPGGRCRCVLSGAGPAPEYG
jgi:hypothetical protein